MHFHVQAFFEIDYTSNYAGLFQSFPYLRKMKRIRNSQLQNWLNIEVQANKKNKHKESSLEAI